MDMGAARGNDLLRDDESRGHEITGRQTTGRKGKRGAETVGVSTRMKYCEDERVQF